LQELLDRQDIQDTTSRYSLGQDSHQGDDSGVLEQWDEVFTDDGTVDYSAASAPVGSYRDLAKWMRGARQLSARSTLAWFCMFVEEVWLQIAVGRDDLQVRPVFA
jgi:SnoaL-like domain